MGDVMSLDKLDEILAKLTAESASIYGLIYETNNIVKDIRDGTKYAEWIEDLKTSKKNSITYNDASRMLELISYRGAVADMTISQLLLQWAIDNSQMGRLAQTSAGDSVSGVDWASLKTLPDVFGNADVFAGLINTPAMAYGIFPDDYVYSELVKYNGKFLNELTCEFGATTDEGIHNNATAVNALLNNSYGYNNPFGTNVVSANQTKTVNISGCSFMNTIECSTAPESVTIANTKSGLTLHGGTDFELKAGTVTINRFVDTGTSVSVTAGSSSCKVTIMNRAVGYV